MNGNLAIFTNTNKDSPMKIHSFVCLFIGLCSLGHSQVISDSKQKVGGGGYYTRIATDGEVRRSKELQQTPTSMTSKMIWVTPGKVVARHKKDGEIVLEISYLKKTTDGEEGEALLVADHPDAPFLAVEESAKCIVVPGPIRDDFQGRRIYYFFDKKEVSNSNMMQFKARHADAELE
jgi:hypothetical protein